MKELIMKKFLCVLALSFLAVTVVIKGVDVIAGCSYCASAYADPECKIPLPACPTSQATPTLPSCGGCVFSSIPQKKSCFSTRLPLWCLKRNVTCSGTCNYDSTIGCSSTYVGMSCITI